ncbi:MAG: hypothetical protein ACK55Z_02290, partial [bacterium]
IADGLEAAAWLVELVEEDPGERFVNGRVLDHAVVNLFKVELEHAHRAVPERIVLEEPLADLVEQPVVLCKGFAIAQILYKILLLSSRARPESPVPREARLAGLDESIQLRGVGDGAAVDVCPDGLEHGGAYFRRVWRGLGEIALG